MVGLLLVSCGAIWVARSVIWVSSPGRYRGYSIPRFEGGVRTSEYLTTRDGTKLAIDVFRPSSGGEPAAKPLPAVWSYMRYHRATVEDGNVVDELTRNYLPKALVRHGYVVAVVDVRGTGASFGKWDGPFSPVEAQDSYDVTEWIAQQPWCNGRVGMYGASYSGITQYFAAGMLPPHLKAIFPRMASLDTYSTAYRNGILQEEFITNWSKLVRDLDSSDQCAPVDEDDARVLYTEALQEHQANRYPDEIVETALYRDSLDPVTGTPFYPERSPLRCRQPINESQVAIYHASGWYDIWVDDAFLWFNNLQTPQRIIIGPWSHAGESFNYVAEHLRWFDYWLKEVDNGVMDEPPVYYFTMGAPPGQEWRTAQQWPLPNEQRVAYYFQSGRSGTVNSANDGILATAKPSVSAQDE